MEKKEHQVSNTNDITYVLLSTRVMDPRQCLDTSTPILVCNPSN